MLFEIVPPLRSKCTGFLASSSPSLLRGGRGFDCSFSHFFLRVLLRMINVATYVHAEASDLQATDVSFNVSYFVDVNKPSAGPKINTSDSTEGSLVNNLEVWAKRIIKGQ
jgi:hypothetical protein